MKGKQPSRSTVLEAIELLSLEDKIWLREKLDSLLRSESEINLRNALKTSWSSNLDFSQEEVMADVLAAIEDYRTEKRSAGRN